MAKTKLFRTFTDSLPKNLFFCEISPESFSQGFLLIFKFSKSCPKIHREFPEKLIDHRFYLRFSFSRVAKFSENFETILVNVHFQFCLAAESIGQDVAILPDDQPVKL